MSQKRRESKVRKRAAVIAASFFFLFSALSASAAEPATGAPAVKTRPNIGSTITKPVRKTPARKPVRRPAAIPAAPKNAPQSRASVQRASAASIETRLDSFQRRVEVQPAGSGWKKAERKMPLISEDKIRTGGSSVARIKLADGTKVLLLQNSQAEMSSLTTVEKSIRLLKGRIRAIVKRMQGGNNFKITTPVGVASVRGTDFEVQVNDEGSEMEVRVFEGSVAVAKLGDLANEVVLLPGDRLRFGIEGVLEQGNIQSGSVPLPRMEIRNEIQLASAKDAILSMAAEESRNADYQVGKSLIDFNGKRVRVEEYITRPAANEFKLVVLNERATRFDYFTYKGTFNQALPEDLSVALWQVGGQLTDQPDYHLTAYETLMSNTVDSITENASGGHLVQIGFDGTTYTLTDPTDPGNTRTIAAAAVQGDGSYKIYNPLRDTFSVVSAANKDEAVKVSVLDSVGGNYRVLGNGDVYWKTRFNSYENAINGVLKTAFEKKSGVTNTLATDFDANFSNAPILTVIEQPSGTASLHNRLSLYYGDGSKTTYDTYIIDDEGTLANTSDFSGVTTSAEYRDEIDKWNYQQRVTSDEMGGRSIDLVVDPRIGTISGLIQ